MPDLNDWRAVKIRDVTLRAATWDPASDPRRSIRYVDVSAVSRETLEIADVAELAAKDAPSRARKIIRADDTIFATVRPTLKRVAQVPGNLDGEIASTAFCVLRCNPSLINADFLFFSAIRDPLVAAVASLETGASYPAVRDGDILDQEILLPPLQEQERISAALKAARNVLSCESSTVAVAQALKRAAMQELFTRGLRGEAQKETEIGPVPESWRVAPLEAVADIFSSSRLSYSDLLSRNSDLPDGAAVKVLGIKVADMGRIGPERPLSFAELMRRIPSDEAEVRCIRPGAIVFPKNGAAVATNKKRLASDWCVLDPNVMALHAKGILSQAVLFQWIQGFDLASIVKPGPVPNFGKGDIANVKVPVPPMDEQHDIIAILDAIDRKIDLHKRKKKVLKELFKALLHKLMTGEIRVADLDLSALAPGRAAEAAA